MQNQGKAIPMINYDSSLNRFIINPEAESFLRSLQSPLGIISVAGMYRTGKSYLLNRMLLNQSSGFDVGPSINPCTKGLWMWNKTISAHTPEGQSINCIIIDTEGIGATDEDHNHDNKIMTLAILLSSYFIFNSLGTIDENAIQNLSFIVNITKNIQMKNSSHDFSMYLPTFMWVIRDFSLQLKNSQGQPITSKEYLEKSLELQKGNSEFINNKNHIRTLVKEYFPNRDCVTLVRPLTEEGNLQNLEKMDTSKLRVEFIDQINKLRKTVLNSIKPKKLNGQMLNGDMFVNLVISYVTMINKGAIPIIKNAWTYMCENETKRAQETSIDMFTKQMINIENKLPMSENDLKILCRKMKYEAIENYNNSAIGDFDNSMLNKLKNELKTLKKKILEKNIEICNSTTKKFMEDNFKKIDDKVKNGLYKSVQEYKDDIEKFINHCIEKCPNGPGRDVLIYEFIIKNMINHSNLLSQNTIKEMENLLLNHKNEMNNLKNQEDKSKNNNEKLIQQLNKVNEKLKKLEDEKTIMSSQSSNENENFSKLIDEKNNEIINLKNKLTNLEKENYQKILDMKKKVNDAEKASHEKEMQTTEISSNFEKEKVLMEQKILFLEKNLKEINDQQNDSKRASFKNSSSGNDNNSQKEKISQLELEIKNLNKKVSELQEKNIELDSQLLTKGKRIEKEKNDIEELLETYQKKLEDIKNSNENLTKEINNFKIESSKENEEIISDFEKKIEDLNLEQKNLDDDYKTKEEELRKKSTKLNIELSVLKQDNENIESKISEIKDQNQTDKIEHDKYIKILEENNKDLLDKYEKTSKNNIELKTTQSSELARIINENSQRENEVKTTNQDLINKLNILIEEYTTKIKELKEKLFENENNIIPNSKQTISDLEAEIERFKILLEDNQKSHKNKLAELSLTYKDQQQDIISKNRDLLEDNNNQNDKEIQEIRKLFQIEKEKILEQIKQENEEAQEKLTQIEIEQTEKLNQIEKEKDDKIIELQDNLDEINIQYDEYVKNSEKELYLRNQKIESLNNFINDTKESISTIKSQQEISLKAQEQQFENEKKEINDKIDKVKKDLENNNIELSTLNEQNIEFQNLLTELTEKLKEINEELLREKEEADFKIDELKNRLNSINTELNVNKVNYQKELSLKQKEIDFNNEKLNQIKNELEEFKATFELKIAKIKEEIINEYMEKINSIQKEKELIENTLSDLNKEYLLLEEKFKNETEKLKKEKENLNDQLNQITLKKKQLSDELEKEHLEYMNLINKLKNDFKIKNEALKKQNKELQEKLQKLELEYNKLVTNYDREKSTWDDKFKYIMEQIEQIKNELKELKIKYDLNMDELQKKILAERERLEKIYKDSLNNGENIHNEQLKQAQDTWNKKYEDVNEQNKNLDSENALLLKKIESYENNGITSEIDEKLRIAFENENKLKEQLDNLTKEKDEKISQLNEKLNNERENYKKKLELLQLKLADYEERRNDKNADFLKAKAVHDKNSENNTILIQQLNEKLERLQKENERLLNEQKEAQRENENIRKSSRNSSSSHNNTPYIPIRTKNYSFSNSNKENLRTHQYNNNVSVVEKNEPNGKIVTTTKTIVKKVITKTNTKNDEPTIIQSIEETHNSEI